jgi:hypothetical protein
MDPDPDPDPDPDRRQSATDDRSDRTERGWDRRTNARLCVRKAPATTRYRLSKYIDGPTDLPNRTDDRDDDDDDDADCAHWKDGFDACDDDGAAIDENAADVAVLSSTM